MQNGTEKKRKGLAAAIAALVMVVILGLVLLSLLAALEETAVFGIHLATAFLVVYALVVLAMILGVIAALRQRLRELKGGEEEEAKKYQDQEQMYLDGHC